MGNLLKLRLTVRPECGVQLKLICAWCGKVIREGDENSPPSHGICESCKYKELKRVGLR